MSTGEQSRREIKDGIKRRKTARRATLRESYTNMTRDGIPRRMNGSKLGHRRRLQLLQALMATW